MPTARSFALAVLLLAASVSAAGAPAMNPAPATNPAPTTRDTSRGDAMLNAYFRNETAALADRCLADVKTLADWTDKRDEYRRQLAEMLGLWPTPERTDLKATVTATTDHPEFTVERLHFQSRPGLYVTADCYVPKHLAKPAPAILYACGHSLVKKDGVSYGNKVGYQHQGAWFARNGYVCLVIDTIQLGEIEGIHHGTYSEGMWWWHSRGYTPAGVEAWNGIRALDYLSARPDVDPTRIGMTGRSGGGAYTWYVAALDERVKVAVPVAGITDLTNHVVDGCIDGHCDCMFMVNTYRWDFAQVAVLVAPRPLLIGNSDKDAIFPLDGVYRLHQKVCDVYKLYGQEKNLGLLITEGPHKDTQDLQVPAFRWFNRFLKGEEGPVEKIATSYFEPSQLKVFAQLPADQLNKTIQETFVPAAPAPAIPESAEAWAAQRDRWMAALRDKTFGGWPTQPPLRSERHVVSATHGGIRFASYEFTSQHDVDLTVSLAWEDAEVDPKLVVLNVLDEAGRTTWLAQMRPGFEPALNAIAGAPLPPGDEAAFLQWSRTMRDDRSVMAWVAPRGVGPTAWGGGDAKRVTQIRRRFALLGQTDEGMQAWDVRRAVQVLRETPPSFGLPVSIRAERRMAGVALYASLFEPNIEVLDLWDLPKSHRDGPELLNVLKTLDMPAAVALATERLKVRIYQPDKSGWEYPAAVAAKLGWAEDQLRVRAMPGE